MFLASHWFHPTLPPILSPPIGCDVTEHLFWQMQWLLPVDHCNMMRRGYELEESKREGTMFASGRPDPRCVGLGLALLPKYPRVSIIALRYSYFLSGNALFVFPPIPVMAWRAALIFRMDPQPFDENHAVHRGCGFWPWAANNGRRLVFHTTAPAVFTSVMLIKSNVMCAISASHVGFQHPRLPTVTIWCRSTLVGLLAVVKAACLPTSGHHTALFVLLQAVCTNYRTQVNGNFFICVRRLLTALEVGIDVHHQFVTMYHMFRSSPLTSFSNFILNVVRMEKTYIDDRRRHYRRLGGAFGFVALQHIRVALVDWTGKPNTEAVKVAVSEMIRRPFVFEKLWSVCGGVFAPTMPDTNEVVFPNNKNRTNVVTRCRQAALQPVFDAVDLFEVALNDVVLEALPVVVSKTAEPTPAIDIGAHRAFVTSAMKQLTKSHVSNGVRGARLMARNATLVRINQLPFQARRHPASPRLGFQSTLVLSRIWLKHIQMAERFLVCYFTTCVLPPIRVRFFEQHLFFGAATDRISWLAQYRNKMLSIMGAVEQIISKPEVLHLLHRVDTLPDVDRDVCLPSLRCISDFLPDDVGDHPSMMKIRHLLSRKRKDCPVTEQNEHSAKRHQKKCAISQFDMDLENLIFETLTTDTIK
jgi:hypothetical protein